MEEGETRRRAVPFRDQAAVFRLRTKAIANQAFFCCDDHIRLALIFGQAADKAQHQRSVGWSGGADGEHDESPLEKVTAKGAKDAKPEEDHTCRPRRLS